jgi:hypothetical protein
VKVEENIAKHSYCQFLERNIFSVIFGSKRGKMAAVDADGWSGMLTDAVVKCGRDSERKLFSTLDLLWVALRRWY